MELQNCTTYIHFNSRVDDGDVNHFDIPINDEDEGQYDIPINNRDNQPISPMTH